MNSASMVEIVTIVYFRLFQMIGQPAKKTIWPPIETLVNRSSAKDTSPYACKWRLKMYWQLLVRKPTDFVPTIYCQDWKPSWNGLRTRANPRASFSTKIATYRNGCPFRLIHGCLLLVLQSLTQAYAVPYTAICRHADAYSKPSGLHGFLRCYSLSCTVAYFSSFSAHVVAYFYAFIFVASQQITQSLTPAHALTNAIVLELQQLHLMY